MFGINTVCVAPMPAAFRRLCVETTKFCIFWIVQSPAAFRRLCVETITASQGGAATIQPPLGGCVLKQWKPRPYPSRLYQPPLGGCVLKLLSAVDFLTTEYPAAFRRLCVETRLFSRKIILSPPAAFRRLCVETKCLRLIQLYHHQPPLGGCVLKQQLGVLCDFVVHQPPLGGCVLKP